MMDVNAYIADMQPTFFINHGGGPCFFLQGPMRAAWKPLEDYLRNFAAALSEPPLALLVISGHWEEAVPTVNVSPTPPLLFDYQGFPDYTYQITWPAPGSPRIAEQVRQLLKDAGLQCAANDRRGYDHGVFIPLKVAFPHADVPVMQLSMHVASIRRLTSRLGVLLSHCVTKVCLLSGADRRITTCVALARPALTRRQRNSMLGCARPS